MSGARLALDVGSVRIGVARCAADQIMAVPVETIHASGSSVSRVVSLATDYDVPIVYVGLPVSLRGDDTDSTRMARNLAQELKKAAPTLDVRLIDERLSTVSANALMRSAGRNSRTSRDVIDQAAAILILEQALDIERRTHRPAGNSLPGETV